MVARGVVAPAEGACGSERMHCCYCGRDWPATPDQVRRRLEGAHQVRGVECPRCGTHSIQTVGDCLACQGRAVIPRDRFPRAEHVNVAEHCLHLWRPQRVEIPRPPVILV